MQIPHATYCLIPILMYLFSPDCIQIWIHRRGFIVWLLIGGMYRFFMQHINPVDNLITNAEMHTTIIVLCNYFISINLRSQRW